MYYFQNVNPGLYQIWVNRRIGAYEVIVNPAPLEDISPIMSPNVPPGF